MSDDLLAAAVSLVVLMAGTGLCLVRLLALRRGRPRDLLPVAIAAIGALAWVATNAPVEGPVLLVLTPGHGLTLSDLVAGPAALVGALVLLDVLRGR